MVGKVNDIDPVTTINTAVNHKTRWQSITRPMFYSIIEHLEGKEQKLQCIDLSMMKEQFTYADEDKEMLL